MKLEQVTESVEAVGCNLSGSRFTDVNLAGVSIENANISEARFEDVNLTGLRLTNANLTGVTIRDVRIEGMTIDGVLVSDMVAAYEAGRRGGSA